MTVVLLRFTFLRILNNVFAPLLIWVRLLSKDGVLKVLRVAVPRHYSILRATTRMRK